ncbi:MAG: HD domain-containing protein [Christensenellaceae bacterium]|jgi:putative hydrolase of HD superfamily
MKKRLEAQMAFMTEIDKLKTVLRQTILIDQTRQETDAEHSWHFAMAAMLFAEYAVEEIDLCKVIKMALVHDLIEIYAGDTFAYDEAAKEGQAAREAAAAKKLFAILPEDQCSVYAALWQEFEAGETPEAHYAAAIDRIQPFINNVMTNGHTWKIGNVKKEQIYARMAPVRSYLPALWPYVTENVEAYFSEKEEDE